MRPRLSKQFFALALVLAALNISHASNNIERLLRRQSGEGEQESTTPKAQDAPNNNGGSGSQLPRLYPDLPRQPNFIPPFNAPPSNGFPSPPLIPFGIQIPPADRLNADRQPAPFGRLPPQPRPMTAAERLQSQTFADGLGKRLLSLVGINVNDKSAAKPEVRSTGDQPQEATNGGNIDGAAKALQNATVLQQLNKGVQSIYGSLSKMYNSTIQDQLNLLQDRFKSETENSTNLWHQRMAQQVPMFFKQMAGRVGEAQEQLNRVWRDLAQVNSSTLMNRQSGQPRTFFGYFDQFMGNSPNEGAFFNGQFSNPFLSGQNTNDQSNQTNQQRDLTARVRELWHTQVQPQIGMVRNQVARAWRDLIASGGLTPDTLIRARSNNNNLGSSANVSTDLVDNILKEVDVNNSEYTLIEPKSDSLVAVSTDSAAETDQKARQQTDQPGFKLNPQMQNRLIEMQREVNQLWMGLTNSLQGALTNVKRTLNPQPQFAQHMDAMASSNRQMETDPAQNEISNKIKDLSKLQRDADMVHEAVQQQQREAQQRQTIGDRFRGYFNNIDMSGVNQLPDRIGEQFNRFGNAVGNFWNRLPERWDNFVTNGRQNQNDQSMMNNRMKFGDNGGETTSTTSTTTSVPSEK